MTIRQATIFDITIIADLWQKMIEEIETEEFQKEQFFLETLSAIINPSHYVAVAEIEGVVIGFISGYIGNMIKSLSTSAGPLTGNNLTVHAINSWIAGSVKNSSNAALKDIDVKIRNTDSSINTSGKTASDGTYRLGVFGGLWYVKAYTEAQGYAPAAEQSVTATDGQSTTVNFTANPVMNNTIVILKAVYTARTKTLLVQASSNNGASAALQLQGYGAMTWNAKLSYWELTVSNVLSAPATVTVVGPEGSKTGNVTIK